MSLEIGLPELAYGSIWLVGAEDNSGLCHLSPLAIYALGTADAVIHDPGIPQPILDLVTPPRYREAAPTEPAIERAIKLAENGWRVVHLVNGSTAERASECATHLAEHGIPLRIASNIGETVVGEGPIALLLVRRQCRSGAANPAPWSCGLPLRSRKRQTQSDGEPLSVSQCRVSPANEARRKTQ